MTLPPPARFRITLAIVIGTVYFVLAHLTATIPGYEWLGVIVGVGALYALTLMMAWTSALRLPLVAIGAVAAFFIAHYWQILEQNFTWFYLFEHAGSNALLAGVFGATLFERQVPLCTRLARMVHGDDLPQLVDRYTRRITIVWTGFFALNATTSLLLYLLTPIGVWSTYANLLTAPLVALMFAGEYAVRVRVLPPSHHSTIAATITAFWVRQYGATRTPNASH
ncbi:MAG TPA: hypothetical protein VIS73_06040 [Rhodocyclaceae bacterium]